MKKTLQNKDSGFTIIEVLIVLAIAALILVVVLVAIPQLQRNQRNSARQADASRVVTSVQNWSANNNGQVFPGTGAAETSVSNDLGNLSQYELPAALDSAVGGQGAVDDLTNLRIVTAAECGVDGATVGGAPRQIAVQYGFETGTGIEGRCIDS